MIELLPETGLGPSGELIAPPGRRKGLNFDVLHPGKDCGFFGDIKDVDIIPEEDWEAYLEEGLEQDSKYGLGVEYNSQVSLYDQNGYGSCAAEGVCGLTETMRDVAGLDHVLFNPLGTYHTTGGGRDNGSSLIANMNFVRRFGCFPEAVHPRSKGYRAKPSGAAYEAAMPYRIDEFYEIRNQIEFGSALLQRFGVYAGYSGHAWFAPRLMNRSQIKWRNSWGTSWGDRGYGILNFSRVMWGYGCYAVRTTLVDAAA
jgi:hypothetical protein